MKKLQITAAVILAACILSFAVSSLVIGGMAGKLRAQTMAERWSADGTKTAQLSAFLSPEAGLTSDAVEQSLPSALDSELVNASISAPNESARLYAYAYSAEGNITMSRVGDYGKTLKSGVSARVAACGADFFLFHPITMLSGCYFSTTDILNDYVIIDNDLAWQFFGSSDVVGFELLINGKPVYISGVCESGSDGDYAEFYGDTPRIFMPYSLAEELLGELPVTTVELVMPDPISGFAMDIFEKSLSANENYVEYLENSARFTDTELRERLFSANERSVRTKPVAYPYWENTAVKLTDSAAGVYIFKLAPVIIAALILAAELILLYISRKKIFAVLGGAFEKTRRSMKQNKRARERAAKEIQSVEEKSA